MTELKKLIIVAAQESLSKALWVSEVWNCLRVVASCGVVVVWDGSFPVFCFCTSVELGSGGFLTINGLDDIITDHSDGASTLAELLGNMLAHVGSQTLEQI